MLRTAPPPAPSATFLVKASRGERFVTELAVEAASAEAARALVAAEGFAVIAVTEPGRRRVGAAVSRWRETKFDADVFAIELLALLRAGLSANEAVQALAAGRQAPRRQAVMERIREGLSAGQSLAGALEASGAGAPALFVATLRSAERSSDLASALARYVAYQARVGAVRRRLASALIYPAVLLLVAGAVTAFLMLYVVPRFATLYDDVAGTLPFYSALLLATGRWLGAHGWVAVPGVGVLFAGAVAVLVHPGLRTRVLAALWLPAPVAERMEVFHLARLYRTLGMLLRSGIAFVEALALAAELLPARLRPRAVLARARLREGLSISAAFAACGLGTPVAAQLLAVGERTGDIGDMLDRIADFHDEALGRWLDSAMRLFEPLLMAALGLVIGGIVVLMYMPIFELAGGLE